MIDKALFKRTRVRLAQITFYLLFFYSFFYNPIDVMPFTSPQAVAGIGVVLLGTLVRSLAAGFLHKNNVLATTGLYALVRNPLYFGSLLIVIGLNLIIWNPLFAAVVLFLFLMTYAPTIAWEEQKMKDRFPEQWAEFEASTPRLLPKLSRLGAAVGQIEWDFARWKHNREYQGALVSLALLLALFIYSRYHAIGMQ